MGKYNVISGLTTQYYHTIPSDLEQITTSPIREAIERSLERIHYGKFPEFILDILTIIEKHAPVDITDGPGDEKQDILTITPNGKRCLTQCKHSMNSDGNYSGDELDRLVSASLRKNCQEAILVTNLDLTPQAKGYVNDKEYLRGWPDQSNPLNIEYWNGWKIWEKIKNNQTIINKWFSGLGQVHGLKSFKFYVSIQKLPQSSKNSDKDNFEEFFNSLKTKDWITTEIQDLIYKAKISNDFELTLKRWFQYSGDLDVELTPPGDDIDYFYKPLFALAIEVVVIKSGNYSIKKIVDEIIQKLSTEVLPRSKKNNWWHIIVSQIKAFLYLHDINEPGEINLLNAISFVKSGNCTTEERQFCDLCSPDFVLIDSKEKEFIWRSKKNGIQITQLFEQKINPVQLFDYQVTKYHQLDTYKNDGFFAIENIDKSSMLKIRRFLNPEWLALEYNENNLIWGFPQNIPQSKMDNYITGITSLGYKILPIKKEDVANLLENVRADLVPPRYFYHSDLNQLSYPVLINKRIFWLSKDLPIPSDLSPKIISNLVKFKYNYEAKFGFDYLEGKKEGTIKGIEIKSILYDILSIRGRRMLDIGINTNSLSINFRFNEGKLLPSDELAKLYVEEFNKVYLEIKKSTMDK